MTWKWGQNDVNRPPRWSDPDLRHEGRLLQGRHQQPRDLKFKLILFSSYPLFFTLLLSHQKPITFRQSGFASFKFLRLQSVFSTFTEVMSKSKIHMVSFYFILAKNCQMKIPGWGPAPASLYILVMIGLKISSISFCLELYSSFSAFWK